MEIDSREKTAAKDADRAAREAMLAETGLASAPKKGKEAQRGLFERLCPLPIIDDFGIYSDPNRSFGVRTSTDGRGNTCRVVYAGGVAVYSRDQSGEWDSSDGQTWVKRGTSGQLIWRGTVDIDERGRYTITNRDSGVTLTRQPDGMSTSSIVRPSGEKITVTRNRHGTTRAFSDRSGAWVSENGIDWTNQNDGCKIRTTVALDQFGRYWRAGKIAEHSRELNLVLRKQRSLTETYGVLFPLPGEGIRHSSHLTVLARPPTLEELDCLEDVLSCNKQMNVRGLRICFLPYHKNVTEYGWYSSTDNGGKPQLVLASDTKVRGWDNLEGTLHHELVHHEQFKNWGKGQWGPPSTPARVSELMRGLGWQYNSATGIHHLIDHEGREWRRNKDTKRWEHVALGNVVPGLSRTDAVMARYAKVRPATTYNHYPWETHAEALGMYRNDRQKLFHVSRPLYQLMKRHDQEQIDRRFGVTASGDSRMIRSTDGTIVANTAANLKAVTDREASWNAKQPTSPAWPIYIQRRFRCRCCC